ncbi:hypothetical protein [Leptospira johnsonii]|uniref:Uncharacterized protein n=1 Tax=Leptospira johnsonii TaxID=1917820 RepID=A0A2P2D7S2_9LEPT|nr:hypothetical protein [Leptospira johnsonii]GBF40682.1 hypothetical protein LPTSP1_37000 [Leptospira johnsonii]
MSAFQKEYSGSTTATIAFYFTVKDLNVASVHANFAGGATGNFKLQYSNFPSDREMEDTPDAIAAGHWIDIPGKGAALADGTVIYKIDDINFQFLRALLTRSAGTIDYEITAYARGRGYSP